MSETLTKKAAKPHLKSAKQPQSKSPKIKTAVKQTFTSFYRIKKVQSAQFVIKEQYRYIMSAVKEYRNFIYTQIDNVPYDLVNGNCGPTEVCLPSENGARSH